MKKLLFFTSLVLLFYACRHEKQVSGNATTGTHPAPWSSISSFARPDYRPSATRLVDIQSTTLYVRPDWQKRYLYGRAVITANPWFYPTAQAQLDARGMDIQRVALLGKNNDTLSLKYNYSNDIMTIDLDKVYSKAESFSLVIDYTAKPDELKTTGGIAITDDKGLYFIDPDDTDPNIPTQMWTQGETQASSAWFPTIDRPNEKMTSEVYITIQNKYKTLSNGILIKSTEAGGGLRTDHWKMDLPHSPYLVMMAAGEFSVVKDNWRGKEVSYYVEPQFEPYARDIFGKTPAMLEFFSNKLGVEYPWAKYSQICAREFVSGAMENTSATLHGDFVQLDKRELIDRSFEEYVSHELFHQWFGDLVTCESWANLPLNESFATYGEYLWIEHAYGKDEADLHHFESLQGYMEEAGPADRDPDSRGKQEPLIRYFHRTPDDMFDSHSYNKGGQVLHMLRQEVGDEAFFASLKLYLETNRFKTVEIHDLRKAFEEVTGRDLQWFFTQWFMSPGHPELDITYSWNAGTGKQTVIVRQMQDLARGIPVFRLPMNVDLYVGGKVIRNSIVCDAVADTFVFDVAAKPEFVNTDADKKILCRKKDHHTAEEWAFLFRNSSLFMDKYEALQALAPERAESSLAKSVVAEAMKDKFAFFREEAVYKSAVMADSIFTDLVRMAHTDKNSLVRVAAIYMLGETTSDKKKVVEVCESALSDSSFGVIGVALRTLMKFDREAGLKRCKEREMDTHRQMKLCVASAYMIGGTDAQQPWFETTMITLYGRQLSNFLSLYAEFLKNCSSATVENSTKGFEKLHAQTFSRSTRFYIRMTLMRLEYYYRYRADETAKQITQLSGTGKNSPRGQQLAEQENDFRRLSTLMQAKREELRAMEK